MAKDHKPYSLGSMVRETEAMKPTDKACIRQVSKPGGCNGSEPIGSLVNVLHNGGRDFKAGLKTASLTEGVVKRSQGHHRGDRGDTLTKRDWGTWETLPVQLSLFKRELKSEPYKAEPKWESGRKGVGAVHSSKDHRDTLNLIQGKGLQFNSSLPCIEERLIAKRLSTDH